MGGVRDDMRAVGMTEEDGNVERDDLLKERKK